LDALGKAAYQQQKWDDAVAAFEGAYDADPLPRFLFNLGRCHERRGDLARASHYFERYLAEAPEAEDHAKVAALAKMLRIKLGKSSSKLVVAADQPDALVRVFVEDEPLEGVSPFSHWVPFGKHRVVVDKVGYESWEGVVVVAPDRVAELSVELASAPGAGGRAGPAAAGAAADPMGWLGPAAAGLGVALLAGGGVCGWLSHQAVEDRDALVGRSWDDDVAYADYRSLDETAKGRALLTNVLVGAGAAVAITGGVLWWVAHGAPNDPPEGHATVVPSPEGVVLVWSELLP